MKLSEEFKQAIRELPEKEKDKLLLRLLPKNEKLVKQLEFQLLEEGNTMEIRREEIKEFIQKFFSHPNYFFYSPGYLMMDLRTISGKINEHVSATKDKVGEVELNLLMMVIALEKHREEIMAAPSHKARNFHSYVVKRTLKVLKVMDKLHDDYRIEFEDLVNRLGKQMEQIPLMVRIAEELELSISDLVDF